ncbi:MAG: type II secretion system protein [Bacilli bacterium]
MKKEGFTIVELLAVIALIGVVMGIAVPNVMKIYSKNKQILYDQTITLILSAAEEYGNNNIDVYNMSSTVTVKVQDLINNKLIKTDNGILKNPKDNKSMNELQVYLKYDSTKNCVVASLKQ